MPVRLSRLLTSDKDREEFVASYNNCVHVRTILTQVLEQELEALIRDEEKLDNLSNPNWPDATAHRLGQRKKIRELISFLNYDFKE